MSVTELGVLVERLIALARPVTSWLVPGVVAAVVEEVLGDVLPEEVITWFGWCNGVESHPGRVQDEVNVIPGYAPLSLTEAAGFTGSCFGDPVLGGHALWVSGGDAGVAGVLVGEEPVYDGPDLYDEVVDHREGQRDLEVDGLGI